MWQTIGQNKTVSFLQRSLEQGKLSHAYLLVGPHCVGKMTLSLDLARILNCTGEKPPCGECPACQKITEGKHSDVQIIGLASNSAEDGSRPKKEIGIDPIKQLQHSANLPPFEGKYRVYIIDGAEQMSTEAANCLLKTLEEPASNVLFILLTTNEKLLLETIVSRCQRLELTPLHPDEIEKALIQKQVEPQKATLLSRLCHGCLGWAISASSDNSVLEQRRERLDKLQEINKAGYDDRFAYASELASQFSRNRESIVEILNLWIDWWHDLMLMKTNLPDAIINPDLMDTLAKAAEGYSLTQIRSVIAAIQSADKQLKLNTNPQLTLEVLMLGIPYKITDNKKVSLTS